MKEYIPKNETWLRLQIKQFVAFNPKRKSMKMQGLDLASNLVLFLERVETYIAKITKYS